MHSSLPAGSETWSERTSGRAWFGECAAHYIRIPLCPCTPPSGGGTPRGIEIGGSQIGRYSVSYRPDIRAGSKFVELTIHGGKGKVRQ